MSMEVIVGGLVIDSGYELTCALSVLTHFQTLSVVPGAVLSGKAQTFSQH